MVEVNEPQALTLTPLSDPRLGPPVDADLATGGGDVLLIGLGLPGEAMAELVRQGCVLTRARDMREGLRWLRQSAFMVVVVAPGIDEEGDGVRLVSAIKNQQPWTLGLLGFRYEAVPFVILPLADQREFAVIRAPDDGVLTSTEEVDLARAILRAHSLGREH